MIVDLEITYLMIELVEKIGDKIGVEFRSGTDRNSKVYNTDEGARRALYSELGGMQKRLNDFVRLAENDGAYKFKKELKQLLDIGETNDS